MVAVVAAEGEEEKLGVALLSGNTVVLEEQGREVDNVVSVVAVVEIVTVVNPSVPHQGPFDHAGTGVLGGRGAGGGPC